MPFQVNRVCFQKSGIRAWPPRGKAIHMPVTSMHRALHAQQRMGLSETASQPSATDQAYTLWLASLGMQSVTSNRIHCSFHLPETSSLSDFPYHWTCQTLVPSFLLTQAVKGAMMIFPSRDDCKLRLRFHGYSDAQHQTMQGHIRNTVWDTFEDSEQHHPDPRSVPRWPAQLLLYRLTLLRTATVAGFN